MVRGSPLSYHNTIFIERQTNGRNGCLAIEKLAPRIIIKTYLSISVNTNIDRCYFIINLCITKTHMSLFSSISSSLFITTFTTTFIAT